MPLEHWLTIHFKKVLTSLLWEMKKTIKILIVFFFSFPIKTFFNWILNQCPKGICGGPKFQVPTHFVLRAQSPGRGALLSRTRSESSLEAQGCGQGRSHAQHLIKRLKKRTNSVQEQYKEESCQHRNVESCT